MSEAGANPARVIPAIQAAADAGAPRSLYFVGEHAWPDRPQEELGEALWHDALLNHAFSSPPVQIFCAYNVSALAAPVIAEAERAHPWLWDDAGHRPSPSYSRDTRPTPSCEAPLQLSPPDAFSMRFELRDLACVRAVVRECAERAALTLEQCGNVVLGVDELATNSIRHGGGMGTLRVWNECGRVICEVHDAGRITDSLVGRIRPASDAYGGRGLWLVNQLCDLVQIRTGASGTTIRLHVRRRWDDVQDVVSLAHGTCAGTERTEAR